MDSQSKEMLDAEIQLLESELLDCRTDERDSQGQILQVLSVTSTLLGLLLGGSFYLNTSGDLNKTILSNINSGSLFFELFSDFLTPARIAFICNNMVFCVTLTYILKIGLISILRYFHMKDLQLKIRDLFKKRYNNQLEDENVYLWDEVKAPILTLNLKHIHSYYAIIHFFSYSVSVVFLVSFCLILAFIQFGFLNPKHWYDYIGFLIVGFIVLLCIAFYFYTSKHGRKMNDTARKGAENRLKGLDGSNTNKKLKHNIVYFIYPRTNDLQKPLLIVMGAVIYYFACHITLTTEMVWNIILSVIVFDFCAYQARFQINDLRGISEDKQSENNNRLITDDRNIYYYVITSITVICIRIIMCIILIAFFSPAKIRPFLIWELLGLVIITVLYEVARSRKKDVIIFLLVGLGYPLRVATGALSVFAVGNPFSLQYKYVFFFLLAMYFWGMFASLLSWATDVIKIYKKAVGSVSFKKSHFSRIFNSLDCESAFPLRNKGTMKHWWNHAFVFSMCSLMLMELFELKFSIMIVAIEVIKLFLLFLSCYLLSNKNIEICLLTIMLFLIFPLFISIHSTISVSLESV